MSAAAVCRLDPDSERQRTRCLCDDQCWLLWYMNICQVCVNMSLHELHYNCTYLCHLRACIRHVPTTVHDLHPSSMDSSVPVDCARDRIACFGLVPGSPWTPTPAYLANALAAAYTVPTSTSLITAAPAVQELHATCTAAHSDVQALSSKHHPRLEPVLRVATCTNISNGRHRAKAAAALAY